MNRLEGKTAIVTGGSRGIGEAVALRLAREGADVAVCASRSVEAAKGVSEKIEGLGRRALGLQADVSDPALVETLFETVLDSWGRVDILVSNAGVTRDSLLMRMKEADWDVVLDVNLKGAFLCIKAAARVMMRARSGRIVTVSSVTGLVGNPGQINYTASQVGPDRAHEDGGSGTGRARNHRKRGRSRLHPH